MFYIISYVLTVFGSSLSFFYFTNNLVNSLNKNSTPNQQNLFKTKIFYYLLPLSVPNNKKLPWITYIYSTIHALISFIAAYSYLYDYITTYEYLHLFALTVGYAIHDFIVVWRNREFFKSSWKGVLVHHSMMMYNGLLVLSYYNSLEIVLKHTSRFFLTEISTVFLNISWFLITLKKTRTSLFKINGIILICLYFIVRILNLTYCCYLIYTSNEIVEFGYNTYRLINLGAITLTSMNYIWFYNLFHSTYKKITTADNKTK